MKEYIYVSGGKGGVGKSAVVIALTDYKSENGNVFLIDADPVNADSSASYMKDGNNKQDNVQVMKKQVRCEDTDGQIDPSGLINTLNVAINEQVNTVIVDAPSGDSTMIAQVGSIITESCKLSGIKSVIIWMVEKEDRTPVNTIAAAWDNIKDADCIYLVKNNRHGSNFEFFDNSSTIKKITEEKNVHVINMPKIASRIEGLIRIDRLTWKEVATLPTVQIADRVEGQRMRKELHKKFKEFGL
jgi:hypothetical protein